MASLTEVTVVLFLIAFVNSTEDFCGWTANKYEHLFHRGSQDVKYVLKQVHVIIRHGDRTIAKAQNCWPNDTAIWDCSLAAASTATVKHDQHSLAVNRVYRKVFLQGREVFPGDCYVGQLTHKGYEQQENNGRLLRKAYVESGFISRNYNHSKHYFRSDDLPRTLQSVQALAGGLFPVTTTETGKAEVVDIHTMDRSVDDMVPNAKLCPKLLQYMKEWIGSETYKRHYNLVTRPLLEDIAKALGLTMPIDLTHIGDCIVVHGCHRKTIPVSITKELQQRIAKEMEWEAYASYSFPSVEENSRVGIGFLIQEIWKEMQKTLQGEEARELYVYSGHDSTVMPLLNAFNVSNGTWPPYGSMIQLELYEATGIPKRNVINPNFAVRMIYNGKEIRFPFCDGSPCDALQFGKYVAKVIPIKDLIANCEVSDMADDNIFEPMKGMVQRLHWV